MADKALTKIAPDIIGTIDAGGRVTLVQFARNLKAQELISTVVQNQAKQAPTVFEGADMLITAVQNKVKSDSAKFDKFLEALRDSGLEDYADELKKACCELATDFCCHSFSSPLSLFNYLSYPTHFSSPFTPTSLFSTSILPYI